MDKENTRWSVVVVEQGTTDITVYDAESEDDAQKLLRTLWEHDIATEIAESLRELNLDASFCDDMYAELWYTTGESPIKYFAEPVSKDIAPVKDAQKLTSIININSVECKLSIGQCLKELSWHESSGKSMVKSNLKVVFADENRFIVTTEKAELFNVMVDNVDNIKAE